MRQLLLKPAIYQFAHCRDFAAEFQVGRGDLIITNSFIYEPYFSGLALEADVLYQERYGAGEPSDEMAEAIYADIRQDYKRIIAIGGGTVLDLAKIYALKQVSPVLDLFDRKLPLIRGKQLILVPTTCGTGSEVTNVSILSITSRASKLGLAADELFADAAVLIPELLATLPYPFFATSSIDALIHAVESSVSPKATAFTRLFGYRAIETIIRGYQKMVAQGAEARLPLLPDFLLASTYAGIAFGNAGVGAVHAMSYPLSGKYHVAHGEANYVLFTSVFRHYLAISGQGAIAELNMRLATLLGCGISQVYVELEKLLEQVITRKPLRAYGVTEADIADFTANVLEKQGRLTANNFVPLSAQEVAAIYRELL